jgi:hypothetical protein
VFLSFVAVPVKERIASMACRVDGVPRRGAPAVAVGRCRDANARIRCPHRTNTAAPQATTRPARSTARCEMRAVDAPQDIRRHETSQLITESTWIRVLDVIRLEDEADAGGPRRRRDRSLQLVDVIKSPAPRTSTDAAGKSTSATRRRAVACALAAAAPASTRSHATHSRPRAARRRSGPRR